MLTNIVSKKKSTRRGITPIIAVILLLLMTVAAAGAAFLWITKFQGLVSQQMNKQLGSEQRCEGIKLSIDQVWLTSPNISFTLRNAGTYNLKKANEWEAITITGGVSGGTQSFTNVIGAANTSTTPCFATVTIPDPWLVGATYKITCADWFTAADPDENDVYAVTAQPPCGTPATNSVVYTT